MDSNLNLWSYQGWWLFISDWPNAMPMIVVYYSLHIVCTFCDSCLRPWPVGPLIWQVIFLRWEFDLKNHLNKLVSRIENVGKKPWLLGDTSGSREQVVKKANLAANGSHFNIITAANPTQPPHALLSSRALLHFIREPFNVNAFTVMKWCWIYS